MTVLSEIANWRSPRGKSQGFHHNSRFLMQSMQVEKSNYSLGDDSDSNPARESPPDQAKLPSTRKLNSLERTSAGRRYGTASHVGGIRITQP
eukprot:COSAG02_NODE_37778_length_437_cov_1.455621_1_plen_91_part_01